MKRKEIKIAIENNNNKHNLRLCIKSRCFWCYFICFISLSV